jgi:mannose-6-phosphate isomerase-like protein (cupin superfamily)
MVVHQTLLDEMSRLMRGIGGDLTWFTDRMWNMPALDTAAQPLSVLAQLPAVLELSGKQTRTVVQAICDAASSLNWQQSYTHSDGFDRAYLDNYGWFNLVSPDGVFLSDTIRVSVGYWGKGLSYVEHWHEPEEFYLVLAGGAEFHSKGRAPRRCGPGDVVHHLPNQPHSIEMNNGPLLAAAFWRGERLLRKPDLAEST